MDEKNKSLMVAANKTLAVETAKTKRRLAKVKELEAKKNRLHASKNDTGKDEKELIKQIIDFRLGRAEA